MNDMNTTILEIRRRGAERIQSRKRRRSRITAVCVPVVLCAALLWAVPKGVPTSLVDPEETESQKTVAPTNAAMMDSAQTVPETLCVSLRITGQGTDLCCTDTRTVGQFLDTVEKLKTQAQCASFTDVSKASTETADSIAIGEIRICLEEAGETEEYLLNQLALYDCREKIAYPISSGQYRELLRLLGIETP